MTTLNLILVQKTEQFENVGLTRMLFLKNPAAPTNPMNGAVSMTDLGAADIVVPNAEAADYVVGQTYTFSIATKVSLAEAPSSNVIGLASKADPGDENT